MSQADLEQLIKEAKWFEIQGMLFCGGKRGKKTELKY